MACPNMEAEEVGCCGAGDENKPPEEVDPELPKIEDPVAGAADVTAEPKIDCPDEANGEADEVTVLEPKIDLFEVEADENGDCPKVL